jgi:hypothetical protein
MHPDIEFKVLPAPKGGLRRNESTAARPNLHSVERSVLGCPLVTPLLLV